MFNVVKVEREIAGRTLSIETGKIARQADGAVIVRYGETVVLVAAVVAPPRSEDIDFFPLSVEYRERHSAAGKFPGGFIKREGRPSTKETLTSRMIDRPLRPLFPDGYFNEVQIIASVLSADKENDPDVPAMIGASAALSISKIPFNGPTGACRVGRVNGEFVINPTHEQMDQSDLNVLVGGRKDAINMIEVAAKELPESVVADAIKTGQETVKVICELIEELQKKVGVPKEMGELFEIDEKLCTKIRSQIADELRNSKLIPTKHQRRVAVSGLLDRLIEQYCEAESDDEKPNQTMIKRIFDKIEGEIIRDLALKGKRLDGRSYDDVRPITCEVGVLPRVHGSALFTRGETQALVCITLGTIQDAQIIDGLQDEYAQSFALHYNFPPIIWAS
jgi:polyribonucleotide nucleotidyltransferase